MFVAYLAGSAGRVVIPEAVEVISSGTGDEVGFVDYLGRVLVSFRRQDLAIYSKDADPVGDLMAHDGASADGSRGGR
jgi:hypothetical protein